MTRPEPAGPHLIDRRLLLKGAGVTGALAALGIAGASPAGAAPSPAPASCRQLVTVDVPRGSSTVGTLRAWQRYADGSWKKVFGPLTAHVGALGVGKASEGSSITPAGTFPMNVAFGRQPDPGTAMSYFQTDPMDWWDCNPQSSTYNQHVRRSSSPGGASENLYYVGALYDYAVNINHNPRRTPYAGSAIFLHVTDGGPTGGCVSIGRSSLASILRWLRPGDHPHAHIRVGSPWLPPEVPLGQAKNFIRELYLTVMGIVPSSAAIAARADAVHRGADRGYIGRQFATSIQRFDLVTHRAYEAVLGRKATSAELVARRSSFGNGGRVDDLFVKLAASAEAWTLAGKSTDRWVQRTCKAFIGRESDRPATWAAMAKTSGRGATARELTRTVSFGDHRLNLLYRQMLGRLPTATASSAYRASMAGRGEFDMPARIAAGSEFFARAQR